MEVNVRIRAVPLHGSQLQAAAEIPRVKAAEREAHPVASEREGIAF